MSAFHLEKLQTNIKFRNPCKRFRKSKVEFAYDRKKNHNLKNYTKPCKDADK